MPIRRLFLGIICHFDKILMTMIRKIIPLALCVAIGMPTFAQEPTPAPSKGLAELFGQKKTKFLPVHQAFGVSAQQEGERLVVSFKVTPEHYIYQDKLSLILVDGVSAGAWQFDKTPTTIDDPTFGQVAVFEEDVVASVVLSTTKELTTPIKIKWQGCAKAGLCYPPETLNATISLKPKDTPKPKDAPSASKSVVPSEVANLPAPTASDELDPKKDEALWQTLNQDTQPALSNAEPPVSPIVQLTDEVVKAPEATVMPSVDGNTPQAQAGEVFAVPSETVSSSSVPSATTASPTSHMPTNQTSDPFGIRERPVMALGLLFMLGLLLALTPCVYPMIPIVANIVARQGANTAKRGLLLSASYGVGVATAYGLLGMIIAWFGQALGIVGHLQNPYVLGAFALVFVLLALGMFDVIRLKLPSAISQKLQQQSQSADRHLGSLGGSFLVGLLSALVVSPCVSLPMAGALSAVATTANVWFGFVALFMLGLGLSVPLVIMGAMQGKFMPKSGVWMVSVKEFCGLLLLAVAVSLVERIWLSPVVLVLWAVWFALFAVWLYRLQVLPARALSLVAGAWVVCLMAGASMGNSDAWRPLGTSSTTKLSEGSTDLTITTLAELDGILQSHDKVLVDVTATWCVECRIMERTLFTNRPSELSDYQVVKLDITDTNDDSRAVLARYQLFGPPALLIYHQGQLKDVLLGETKRDDFIKALSQ